MGLKILTIMSMFIIIVLLSGCADECNVLKEKFDDYASKAKLSLLNNESLCHGLNMGSDFSGLTPRWVIGKLVMIDGSRLTFQGMSENVTMVIPDGQYVVGKEYKIDMNNVCRDLFVMVDSRYPSPVMKTIIRPEEINCI